MSKSKSVLLAGAAVMLSAGCAPQYEGGIVDRSNSDYWTDTGPVANPTFRPGMNPRDFRDPNTLTRPVTPPATTPP